MRCQDCGDEIPYGRGFGGSVCSKCRGKRVAKINAENRLKHSTNYMGRGKKEIGL